MYMWPIKDDDKGHCWGFNLPFQGWIQDFGKGGPGNC